METILWAFSASVKTKWCESVSQDTLFVFLSLLLYNQVMSQKILMVNEIRSKFLNYMKEKSWRSKTNSTSR